MALTITRRAQHTRTYQTTHTHTLTRNIQEGESQHEIPRHSLPDKATRAGKPPAPARPTKPAKPKLKVRNQLIQIMQRNQLNQITQTDKLCPKGPTKQAFSAVPT